MAFSDLLPSSWLSTVERPCSTTRMEEAECQHGRGREEENLLSLLVETRRGLQALRCSRDPQDGMVDKRRRIREEQSLGVVGSEGRMGSPPPAKEKENGRMTADRVISAEEKWKERECVQRALRVLMELSAVHSDRVTAWREALGASACMLSPSPPGGSDQQQSSVADDSEIHRFCSDHLSSTLLSVVDDVNNVVDTLNQIRTKLDSAITALCVEEDPTVDLRERPDSHNPPGSDSENQQVLCLDNVNNQSPSKSPHSHRSPVVIGKTSDSCSCSSAQSECGDAAEEAGLEVQGQEADIPHQSISPETQINKETEKDAERNTARGDSGWVTVGLTGRFADGQSDVPDACYIKGPGSVAKVMTCEVADALSSLMVTGSEELVSRVLRVGVQDGTRCLFPVTVIVPFRARYRGNYRDVVVKVVDGERRVSYISPISTEGTYGGQRGSFAEARVYCLGLFAVVSCMKRESYTVPRRGLSLKLSMDPRVCLDYLPGSFTAPVVAQSMIQPIDATLLATLKSKCDAYHSVVSTSPLLYLTHPSSQPLRRPLTLTLPCPPNPDKRKAEQGEEPENRHVRPISAAPQWDTPTLRRVRALSASVKSPRELPSELLVLLGWREQQWNVLEKVAVRNLQNGLVSFELTENFDRLLVVRLLSCVRPSHLASLIEGLEESVHRHAVTVVLHRRRDEPHTVLVAALPSRDLSWELSKLRAQGYGGPPDPSPEILMCEGEQLLLCFSGNITSTGAQKNQNGDACERITFHNQHKSRLVLRLTVVDPFGNYSSPHYKGTAIFYKVARGQPDWSGDLNVPSNIRPMEDPVCKLSLTLPKKVRTINRPSSAKVKLCDEIEPLSDSLLLWLSGELSEEEVALLALSLRLHRSSTQLARLRAGDNLPAQAFHLLALWRRGLPAASHPTKGSQLARCLAKSGRADLARELLLRLAATTRGGSED